MINIKKITRYFSKIKLNNKLTFLNIAILLIPIIIFSSFFFSKTKQSKIQEQMSTVELSMNQNYSRIQKNVELCNMSTQVILNNQNLINYIEKFNDNTKINMKELLEFLKNEIGGLERLVNSNPYLYKINIYVDSNTMPEMMPILYREDRMDRLSWAKSYNITKKKWQFDYKDEVFPSYITNQTKGIVSLVTPITNYGGQQIGVIEVATKMEILFPDIYTTDENQWTCFIDQNNKIYQNENDDNVNNNNRKEIISNLSNYIDVKQEKEHYKVKWLNGDPFIIGYMPIKELSGSLIKIVSLKSDLLAINNVRNIFIISIVMLIFIMIFIVDKIISMVLKKFYVIMKSVREVQSGNLEVEIPDLGEDEIGELGYQINKMLSRIKNLMEVNIKREILVKDSEIRALQNQINAHFIYNVLESIKMMAEIKYMYDISDATTSLGKLLRYSMKWVSNNVTVREEIDYIQNYLSLINLRFDYEVYLSLSIADEIWDQKIPKMSLQPIIENAIYHGIEELAEDTTIYMKGKIIGNACIIEITDTGKGMDELALDSLRKKILGEIETTGGSGNGIGLKNVQDRIQLGFGYEYGISVEAREACFTKVIVKIPINVI